MSNSISSVESTGVWRTPRARPLIAASASPASLRASRHRHEAAEDGPFEQPVKDRSRDRLAERADVDQEGEHGRDRKRDRELHPRLQPLPPDHQAWRLRSLFHLEPLLYLLATTFELMRGGGRLTNAALLCLLTLAFVSGWVAFELSGGRRSG